MSVAIVEEQPRPPKIPITIGIIAVCVVITGLLNWPPYALRVEDIVAPTSGDVWQGHVWALLTCAFAHKEIWHLVFNMWWTRDFGRLLEPRLGPAKYIGFIAASAVVASGWQLIASAQTGIGFSGVVYALFGYVVARRRSVPAFAAFVTTRTIGWLLGWLVLCIVLTVAGIWHIGNAAHAAGLAFGFFAGTAAEKPKWKIPALAGIALLVIGSIVSCTYMPWSAAWRERASLARVQDIARRARAGDPAAEAQVGGYLVRDPKQRKEGLALLEKSAKAGDVTGMNALAWTRATSTDPGVRNAADAIHWAEKAVALAPESASYLDTLAAAYAEAGRWEDAIATQKKALALPSISADTKKELEAHLASFERHEAIRD